MRKCKMILFTFVAVCCICLAQTVFAGEFCDPLKYNRELDSYTYETIWFDNFENYEAKTYTKEITYNQKRQWNDGVDTAIFDIKDIGGEHGKVYSALGNLDTNGIEYVQGNTFCSMDISGLGTASVYKIQYDFMFDKYRYSNFRVVGNKGNINIANFNDGKGVFFQARDVEFRYNEKEWYTLTMYIDFENKLCSLYINGEEVFFRRPLDTQSDCVTGVIFQTGKSNPVTDAYYDNVSISAKLGKAEIFNYNSGKNYETLGSYEIYDSILKLAGNEQINLGNFNAVLDKPKYELRFDTYLEGNSLDFGIFANNGSILTMSDNLKNVWHTVTVYISLDEMQYFVYADGEMTGYGNISEDFDFAKNIFFSSDFAYIDNITLCGLTKRRVNVLADDGIVIGYNDDGFVNISAKTDKSAVMYIAKYSDNGIENVFSNSGVLTDDGMIFAECCFIEKGETLKAFVFNSTSDIMPVFSSESLTYTDDDDFVNLREKWRDYLIGDTSVYKDESIVKNKIDTLDEKVKNINYTMITDGSKPYLWEVYGMNRTADMSNTYNYIYQLALAYSTKGSQFYNDSEILGKIKYAVEFMYQNYYGESEINGSGWRSIWDFNWWDWLVGTPKYLFNTLIVLGDEYSQTEVEKFTSLYGYIISVRQTDVNYNNVCEKAYCSAVYAALTNNNALLKDTLNNYALILKIQSGKYGPKEDGSYLYHNKVPYNGLYGLYFDRVLPVLTVIKDTAFEHSRNYYNFIADYILSGLEPFVVNGGIMAMVSGRSFQSGNEVYNCVTLVGSLIDIMDNVDTARSERLKSFLIRIINGRNPSTILNNTYISFSQLNKLIEMNGLTSKSEPYLFSKTFYNMDRSVWHRENYSAALAMSSSRIANYESCNGANSYGWYTGDGMLYIYNNTDVNQYDRNYTVYANPYKRPGTTVDTQTREAVSVKVGQEYFSSCDFVGGAVMDEMYNVSAMQLESFHNDKYTEFIDTGSGIGQPLHDCNLTAKKSWFMFDNEIVCLGSDINASNGFDVLTVVENRKLKSSNAAETLTVNGTVTEKSDTAVCSDNVSWVHLEKTGGYYFPNGGNVSYKTVYNNRYFFEMWLEHDKNPINGFYEYVLIPNASVEDTLNYAENPDITILSNTDKIQSVREENLKITGTVFWQSATFDGISVSEPLIIIKKQTEKGYDISFCDPTQKLEKVTITLDEVFEIKDGAENIKYTKNNSFTVINIDLSSITGETVSFRVEKTNSAK